MAEDNARGWIFACPDDAISQMDLDVADAPRRLVHGLGSKTLRPAVSENEPPDNFGPDVWQRILGHLPDTGPLALVGASTYGSARLYRINDRSTDYLASWTPDTADDWEPRMQTIAIEIAEDHAVQSSPWRPTWTGAASALLRIRGCALLARSSSEPAALYYYWYEPLGGS